MKKEIWQILQRIAIDGAQKYKALKIESDTVTAVSGALVATVYHKEKFLEQYPWYFHPLSLGRISKDLSIGNIDRFERININDYPDVKKLFCAAPEGEHIYFDPAFLKDIVDLAIALDGSVVFEPTGERSSARWYIVKDSDEVLAYGMLMPLMTTSTCTKKLKDQLQPISKPDPVKWVVMQSESRLMVIEDGHPKEELRTLNKEYFAGEVVYAETPEEAARKYCGRNDLAVDDFKVHTQRYVKGES